MRITDVGIPLFDLHQQLSALHAFHPEIGQDDGIIFLTQLLKRLVSAAHPQALVPAALQHITEQAPHVGVIVDDQYRAPFFSHTAFLSESCGGSAPAEHARTD